MLDWCPVCEHLIPPERYTTQLPPAATQLAPQPTDVPAPDKAPTGGPAKTTPKAGPKRPGPVRQNSRGAAKKGGVQQMTKADNKAAEVATTTLTAAPEAPIAAPVPRRRTIISQEPTPLYCSEKCRLEDEARNNLRPMEYGEVDWNMGGAFAPPFATGFASERSPLPMPYTNESPPPHPFLTTRSTTSASSSTLNTTITASSDSAHSAASHQMQIHPPASDAPRQRPEFLQMTSMPPVPSPRSNTAAAEMSSSAPATTDFTSHPSHAILSELGQPIAHGLPLDRWNTVRNDTTDANAAPRYTSAADLWNTGYTLAIQPGRSRMNSRHPSRMPTPTLTQWEDTTPTQSVLIPRSFRRQDDSLELMMASRRSDSGSSSRSATSSGRRRRSRSKRRNGSECPSDHHSVDARSVTSHSRSSRGSIHGPSSPYKHGLATSLEDSRRHFRTSRQSNHPLSSSFSARDAEEELRKFKDTQKGNDQPATVSQSVPNDRGSWSRTQLNGKGKELPRVAESTTASVNASPEFTKKALAPISTSSSSATIAALPASISTRTTVSTDASSTSSPPKTAASSFMSSALSSSKRNSSFANLATAAVSLFGLGGLGGLTMTAASPSKSTGSASEVPNKTLASVATTPDKEPIRGRSRASSRAQPSHQLLGGAAALASSSSLVEMSKTMASGGSQLPISMSTADMQVAKRPLAPLPKDLEDKLRGSTQTREEGTKKPLTVDVSGKRKEKEKEREEGPMTSPPPTSSTSRSKESPYSAAPPKSAWDPDHVREIKESRRLSREASYHGAHPNMIAYGTTGNVVHPVNPILPSSPGSPTSPGSRSPYVQHHRRRTTSHSKSHSRSHSTATVAEEEGGDKDAPLPRVKSNQSITSMTTSSSRRARHSSREPPSPSATVYSIAGPSAPRIPRGMSMTSLSGQGFGVQHRTSMYGNPVSPGGQPGQGGGAALPRTASQPYMNRWASGSPGAGGSAFGSPNGPTPPGTAYFGHYAPNAGLYGPVVPPLQPLQPLQPLPPPTNRTKPREAPKAAGPMYPVLALPTERRKKIVKKTVVNEHGQEVEVDGEEEEDVYAKPKRLFYFDR